MFISFNMYDAYISMQIYKKSFVYVLSDGNVSVVNTKFSIGNI